MRKFKASGSTGLADALGAALAPRVQHGTMSGKHASAQNLPKQPPTVFINEASEISQEVYDQISKRPRPAAVFISEGAPIPILEKRKREENNNRIKKHASIIKRQDPRLYTEALQEFGLDLEGLNVPNQLKFIAKLEAIRKEYRI